MGTELAALKTRCQFLLQREMPAWSGLLHLFLQMWTFASYMGLQMRMLVCNASREQFQRHADEAGEYGLHIISGFTNFLEKSK